MFVKNELLRNYKNNEIEAEKIEQVLKKVEDLAETFKIKYNEVYV